MAILSNLQSLNEAYFYRGGASLKKQVEAMQPEERLALMQGFFKERVEKGDVARPERLLDRLSTVVPVCGEPEDVRLQLAQAQYYLEMTREKGIDCCERVAALCDTTISILDNVIRAFGIADFFKAAESDLHADFKSNKIMMLLSLFSMLMTMLMPIVGLQVASIAIGSFFITIFVLSFIWPYLKPMPQQLPANAENWTQQIKHGGLIGQGRKEAFDAIANSLKMNRHPILVGPSRVGKSLTAKGFAQAIARGDYPELKGMVVFRINTADLLDQKASFLGGGNNILQQISQAMGRHRGKIILVLDEIHMACKNKEKIGDLLKTFLEEFGEFPHVIGITTDEEYAAHVEDNKAFSNRFDRVNIENTNEDETLRILSDAAITSPQRPLLEEGVLSYIYQKTCTEEAPQPTTALKVLRKCINQTSKTQKSTREKEILHRATQIGSLKSQCSAYRKMPKDTQDRLAVLQQELARLEAEHQMEKSALDNLFKSKELLDKMTGLMYRTVIEAAKAPSDRGMSRLQMARLLIDVLETRIKEQSQLLGIKGIVDRSLVDQTLLAPVSLREEVAAPFGVVED